MYCTIIIIIIKNDAEMVDNTANYSHDNKHAANIGTGVKLFCQCKNTRRKSNLVIASAQLACV